MAFRTLKDLSPGQWNAVEELCYGFSELGEFGKCKETEGMHYSLYLVNKDTVLGSFVSDSL